MTIKLSSDIAALNGLSRRCTDDLLKMGEYCIAHAVFEAQSKNDKIAEIDAGFGTLYVKVEDGAIKYKFIPSETLECSIKEAVRSNSSPIIPKLEHALKQRIDEAYKNLL